MLDKLFNSLESVWVRLVISIPLTILLVGGILSLSHYVLSNGLR